MADGSRPASARLLGDGDVGLWVAYDDREHAKAVPGARWDKGLRCWRIPEMFVHEVDALLDRLNHGGDSQLVDALTTVLRRIPTALQQPTYTALAKAWHPDAGGDLKSMQSLTQARALVTS